MFKVVKTFLFFVILFNNTTSGQITPADVKFLHKKEDSLKIAALQIIQGRNAFDRFSADSAFTKMFVRALKIKNSFYYPFDSLFTISKLAPGDSSFKIFTWQMVINDNVIRQHGAIQIKTADGALKLFPLIDKSDVTINMADTAGNNFGWMGAVYYKIIETSSAGKKYYTLLGYDENNIRSNKKIVEVLTFENREPVFGGNYFTAENIVPAERFGKRLILEYKKNASPRLVYDVEQGMIIYEHLISETNETQKKYSYVGDGDYEGLKWMDAKWVHIDKVFTQQTKEGEEPIPNPIRNANGDIDRSKLKNNGFGDDETEKPEPPAENKIIKVKTTPTKIKVKKK